MTANDDDDRVDILLDARTRALVDRCFGPDRTGSCPLAGRDGVVACAGRCIAPTSADPEYWLLYVPPGSHHCPLTWPLEAAY